MQGQVIKVAPIIQSRTWKNHLFQPFFAFKRISQQQITNATHVQYQYVLPYLSASRSRYRKVTPKFTHTHKHSHATPDELDKIQFHFVYTIYSL